MKKYEGICGKYDGNITKYEGIYGEYERNMTKYRPQDLINSGPSVRRNKSKI